MNEVLLIGLIVLLWASGVITVSGWWVVSLVAVAFFVRIASHWMEQ